MQCLYLKKHSRFFFFNIEVHIGQDILIIKYYFTVIFTIPPSLLPLYGHAEQCQWLLLHANTYSCQKQKNYKFQDALCVILIGANSFVGEYIILYVSLEVRDAKSPVKMDK